MKARMELDRDRIKGYMDAGINFRQMGEVFGCSKKHVTNEAARLGLHVVKHQELVDGERVIRRPIPIGPPDYVYAGAEVTVRRYVGGADIKKAVSYRATVVKVYPQYVLCRVQMQGGYEMRECFRFDDIGRGEVDGTD